MKILLIGLLSLASASAFAMELEYFEDNCPNQMVSVIEIDNRIERLPDSGTNGAVIMAAVQGFVLAAQRCERLDIDLPKVLAVMKQLKIK